ncbi:MAG: Uma2 family endonuclease [Deltaproteobacteria bacterium]|nr:Uma2 family endonuclease [Deltaproteobacteria bacterium]
MEHASEGVFFPPPGIDDRLVMPESRCEVIDGELIFVNPAERRHASLHSKLCAILETHVGPQYDATCDMLTRTAPKGDMAPDASVLLLEDDPETGERHLEELAFEVVDTERLSHASRKARSLTGRGVRRVFAIDVRRARALEWSRQTDSFEILAGDALIEDPALAVALPIEALVDAAKADDAVARALLEKGNPVIKDAIERSAALAETRGEAKGEARGEAKGEASGRAAAVLAILEARDLLISDALRRKILETHDVASLDRYVRRALSVAKADDLLDEGKSP